MDGGNFITDYHSGDGMYFNAYYPNCYEYDYSQLIPGYDYPSNKQIRFARASLYKHIHKK